MQISVIGSSEKDDQLSLVYAYQLGQIMATRGITLVCGGLTGVMSEASRGAFESGGDVLAILPTLDPADANPWVTHTVATGISHARNLAVVASGDVVIALGGHWGTLSEIAYARKLDRAVVCLGDWQISFPSSHDAGLLRAHDPEEAIDIAIRNARAIVSSVERSESVDDKLDS